VIERTEACALFPVEHLGASGGDQVEDLRAIDIAKTPCPLSYDNSE
jgi:hypothetical protein